MRRLVLVPLVAVMTLLPAAAGPAGAQGGGLPPPPTPPPTLFSPTSGTSYPTTLPVSGSVPVPPILGSVTLRFIGDTTCEWMLVTSQFISFTWTIGTDPRLTMDVLASTCPATGPPPGTYTVRFQYLHPNFFPLGYVDATGVVLGSAPPPTTTTTSPPPTTTAPATAPVTTTLPPSTGVGAGTADAPAVAALRFAG